MDRKRLSFVVMAVPVLLGGCFGVRTGSVMLGGAAPAARVQPERVAVYLDERDVRGEFDKVALLTARNWDFYPRERHTIAALQRKAAELGADGIILLPPDDDDAVWVENTGSGTDRNGRAIAIRIR